jgi:hypothetical protein
MFASASSHTHVDQDMHASIYFAYPYPYHASVHGHMPAPARLRIAMHTGSLITIATWHAVTFDQHACNICLLHLFYGQNADAYV